jgi:3-oxoacyl-[acyl-carrier-protein] synthase II
MDRRVVVTGCGVVSPVGIGKDSFWQSLVMGKSGIGPITQFDVTKYDSKIAGEVKDFVPPAFILPKDIKRTPRFVQFALKAAEEAINDSGWDSTKEDPYRCGTIIGCGVGSLESIEREHKVLLEKGPGRVSPFLIPMLITNEAAGNVAIYFGLQGVNYCTVTACASGAHAIGEAYLAIKHNRADVILAGGTEAAIVPLGIAGFCALRALSTRNDQPQRASRPFDKERDGFVMAEGAGIVVLEEYEHAKKRGAHIYAQLSGYGVTCDAYHITAPDPGADAAAKAIQLCFNDSGVDLNHKIYINAHGYKKSIW